MKIVFLGGKESALYRRKEAQSLGKISIINVKEIKRNQSRNNQIYARQRSMVFTGLGLLRNCQTPIRRGVVKKRW